MKKKAVAEDVVDDSDAEAVQEEVEEEVEVEEEPPPKPKKQKRAAVMPGAVVTDDVSQGFMSACLYVPPQPTQREPPAEILLPLLAFQKEFLAWAVSQETGPLKGGILADEMGLGKTIQAISLIVGHRADAGEAAADPADSAPPPAALATMPRIKRGNGVMPASVLAAELSPRGGVGCGTHDSGPVAGRLASHATLVVCPMVAVIQWRSELERHVAPGTLKVVVYHGPSRTSSAEALAAADVVLTTYSIVETEARKSAPAKVACEWCGKKFAAAKLSLHNKYFCGPDAKRTQAQARHDRGGGGGDGGDGDGGGGWGQGKGKGGKTTKAKAPTATVPAKKATSSAAAGGPGVPATGAGAASAGVRTSGVGGVGRTSQAKAKARLPVAKGGGGDDSDGGGSDYDQGGEEEDDEDDDDDEDDEDDDDDDGDGDGDGDGDRGGRGRGAGPSKPKPKPKAKAAAPTPPTPPADVGPLRRVSWRRVILDEAHAIKDRSTATARAVFALTARFRWALSGTPLQNRVGELYSLIRFLRLDPYSLYFCRHEGCGCKMLDYKFADFKTCDGCGHSALRHFTWFNTTIANPIAKNAVDARGAGATRLLREAVLSRVMLRRTKAMCADDLALPGRAVILRRDGFDAPESDYYEALFTQSQVKFGAYAAAGNLLDNYSHLFSLLVRLRQVCDHPYLVQHAVGGTSHPRSEEETAAAEAHSTAETGACGLQSSVCGACGDDAQDPVLSACRHVFCRACVATLLGGGGDDGGMGEGAPPKKRGSVECPQCLRKLTLAAGGAGIGAGAGKGRVSRGILSRLPPGSPFVSSTKIEALREELARMRAKDPSAKALVFSQFTSFLDLVEYRLQQTGVRTVKLEGSTTMEARSRRIAAFSADPSIVVFLMSLKAGGVALNLTSASHVFLLDPWWNGAVEAQAMDRIHRLGQYRPISVTRLIIGGSVEERILALQRKKQALFEGCVGADASALGRLSVEDLRFLFAM